VASRSAGAAAGALRPRIVEDGAVDGRVIIEEGRARRTSGAVWRAWWDQVYVGVEEGVVEDLVRTCRVTPRASIARSRVPASSMFVFENT